MAKEKNEQSAKTPDSAKDSEVIATNLRFYNQGCEVPANALKPIKSGRLAGKSDVNPMWRMKQLTEIFGPCGFGWKYTVDRQWTEVYNSETKCFCNVSLYVRDPKTKEWSEAIPGTGGSAMVANESKGPYVDDDAYKKALTDALSIAMKPLGIGANVWYGPDAKGANESKYEQAGNQSAQSVQQPVSRAPKAAFTGADLNQALSELARLTTREEIAQLWEKWRAICPSLCQTTTAFYKAVAEKNQQLKAAQ